MLIYILQHYQKYLNVLHNYFNSTNLQICIS